MTGDTTQTTLEQGTTLFV